MTSRYATIGVFGLSFLISVTSPFVQTARAQMPVSCDDEIARQEQALGQFVIDARRESMDYILDEVKLSGLTEFRAPLAGDPTVDALEDARQKWEEHEAFIEKGRRAKALLDQMYRCMSFERAAGCFQELDKYWLEEGGLRDRAWEKMKDWLNSLVNERIPDALARVERASKVVENLLTGAGDLATGALSGAMENCFGDFERQVEASNDSVNTASAPPQRQPQPPPRPPETPVDLGGGSGDEPVETGGIGGAVKRASS